LMITPLWPAGEGTLRTLNLNSPREAKECYHIPAAGDALPDVKEGDYLRVGSTDYPIRFVGEWTDADIPSLHIVVTEVKI
jgi:sorbitol-specific phosphotransferase system component IIA